LSGWVYTVPDPLTYEQLNKHACQLILTVGAAREAAGQLTAQQIADMIQSRRNGVSRRHRTRVHAVPPFIIDADSFFVTPGLPTHVSMFHVLSSNK